MAAPTLTSQVGSNFGDATTAEATASLSWNAGDIVVVLGMTGDNGLTLATPTVAGLTFALLTSTNTASTCKAYAWSATAAGSGSGVIAATGGGGAPNARGIRAWAFGGSNGVGASAASAAGSGTTVSLVRTQANSAVVYIGGDFAATNDVTVAATPVTGGTQRLAQFVTGQYTVFGFDWSDEGAIATTSYGITGFTTAGVYTKLAVEIKGTAGGGVTVKQLAALGVG